ncbi:MAG: hypothetical protein KKB03_01785 [Nanoarchaeota archaeon]|nr:hypothetical protein [Nanoarchaeota archaeon]MBU1134968.1 hypothetical protein [Nanoarchaeota archaeon]MBU2519957.1 hypothetical protein [Nanoarchaeota archaeon]
MSRTATDIISDGLSYAIKGSDDDWTYIDETLIPKLEKTLIEEGTDGSEYIKSEKLLRNENDNIRDYGGTVATSLFKTKSYIHSEHSNLLEVLKSVAYEDPEIFPKFRASTALVEADKNNPENVDLDIDFNKLLENFNDAVNEDDELSEVANPYIEYASDKIK